MNISSLQYSKTTKGLRQSSSIRDQHLKFVFIYPLLFDRSLGQYANQIRDFISANILKELFVSSTLNFVNMASQVHPLTDEKGKSFGSITPMGNIEFDPEDRMGGADALNRTAQMPSIYQSELKQQVQQQLHQRTEVIRKLVQSDPILKPLRPFVDVMTMDNFIDVPVIVGTKKFDLDTQVLVMLLTAAVAYKGSKSLRHWRDVEQLFNVISGIKPNETYKLLNNLVPPKTPITKRLKEWFMSIPAIGYFVKQGQRQLSSVGYRQKVSSGRNPERPDEVSKYGVSAEARKETFSLDESIAFTKTTQSNLHQSRLFFKFCLDESMLKRQFGLTDDEGPAGIPTANRSLSTNMVILGEPLKNVGRNMTLRWSKLMTQMQPLLTSYLNLMQPIGTYVDTIQLINKIIDEKMTNQVQDFVEREFLQAVKTTISSKTPSEADDMVKSLKDLCVKEFSRSDDIFNKSKREILDPYVIFSVPLGPNDNVTERYMAFVSRLDTIARKSNTISRAMEVSLTTIFDNDKYDALKTSMIDIIRSNLQQLANRIPNNDPAIVNQGLVREQDFATVKGDLLKAISSYFYFLLMYNVQVALCDLVDVVEVEVETTKHSALDFPNYTLVLPVETIIALAHAVRSKSWKELVEHETAGRPFAQSVSDNYIKEMVKYINKRLDAPNIIVIDKNKGEIYYQLMYHGKVQKAKLATIETFVKAVTANKSNQGNY